MINKKMETKKNEKYSTTQNYELISQTKKEIYNLPTSSLNHLYLEVLLAGEKINELSARKKQINHNIKLSIHENEKKKKVQLGNEKDKTYLTVEIGDIDKIKGSNKPAKRLFVFALIKANEQAINNSIMIKNYVSFPLQELVDIGFYSTVQSARKGFQNGMDTLTSLKVKGHINKSNKKRSTVDSLEVLFTGAKIAKGQCTIYFNERVNWSLLTQYFTILPKYYFRLTNRAGDLLYYIFYLARQNTDNINNRGYFTISMRAVQHHLMLPNEVVTPNPYRDIKKIIEETIDEIKKEHKKDNKEELNIRLIYNNSTPIKDFLENGYLKIQLSDNFSKIFKKTCSANFLRIIVLLGCKRL